MRMQAWAAGAALAILGLVLIYDRGPSKVQGQITPNEQTIPCKLDMMTPDGISMPVQMLRTRGPVQFDATATIRPESPGRYEHRVLIWSTDDPPQLVQIDESPSFEALVGIGGSARHPFRAVLPPGNYRVEVGLWRLDAEMSAEVAAVVLPEGFPRPEDESGHLEAARRFPLEVAL